MYSVFFPWKMMMFHSYASLPEGNLCALLGRAICFIAITGTCPTVPIKICITATQGNLKSPKSPCLTLRGRGTCSKHFLRNDFWQIHQKNLIHLPTGRDPGITRRGLCSRVPRKSNLLVSIVDKFLQIPMVSTAQNLHLEGEISWPRSIFEGLPHPRNSCKSKCVNNSKRVVKQIMKSQRSSRKRICDKILRQSVSPQIGPTKVQPMLNEMSPKFQLQQAKLHKSSAMRLIAS